MNDRAPRPVQRHAIGVALALAFATPLGLGCGGKKSVSGAAASKGPNVTSSGPARWRPVPLPLLREGVSAVYPFPSASARLHIDQSGTRWLLPDLPAPPASASTSGSPAASSPPMVPAAAPTIDLEPIEQRVATGEGELLLLIRDGRLSKLESPLGPPVPAVTARLPEGTIPSTLRRFRGATTVRAKGGLFWSSDGQRFVPVPGPADHAPGEAVLDARGVGVGLFFPERIATTRDAGKSWTVVPLPDAHITSLDRRGDLVVAFPGGIRDAFARTIDPLTGDVARAPQLPTGRPLAADEIDLASLLRLGPRARRRRFQPTLHETTEKAPPPRYVPGEEPRGFHRGPALDGDTVLAFEEIHDKRGQRALQVSTGLLGEALIPFGESALASCNARASAICGVRAAVVCDREIVHFRSGSEIARTAVAGDTVASYDDEGRLWTASPDREAGGGNVVMRRFPIDGALPSPGEEHTRVLGGTTPRFLGGCRAPALWAVGEKAAAKLHGTGFEVAVPLAKDTFPVGIAAGGALVTSTGGELVFLPGEKRVPVKAHLAHHVSFGEDGRHALLSTPSGQLEQSDDGGQTFAPVPTPPVLVRQAIVCGRTRCQLGPSALREGFGRETKATPPWPDPPRDDGAHALHRSTRPEERAKIVAIDHFACRRDESLFRDAPTKSFTVRAGSRLFGSVSDRYDRAPRGFFGTTDGTGEAVPLPPAAGRSKAAVIVSFAGGVGHVWPPTASHDFDPRFGQAAIQWEPSASPRSFAAHYPDVIARDDIWPSTGAGSIFADPSAGELWSIGPDQDARRQVAVSRLPTFERRGGHLGVVHLGRDDVWYGVFPTPPSTAPEHVPTFGLVAAHADAPSEERLVAVGPTSEVEIASGLVPAGDRAGLVSFERIVGTNELELRIRPISADLQLGDAHAIPGTRGPANRLVNLPSCAAGAPGTLLRLDALAPRRVRFEERQAIGYLVRLARITNETACLERSYLVEDREDFEPLLVVATNEGVGFAHEGGVRCTLVPPPP